MRGYILLTLLLVIGICNIADAADVFQVTSRTFKDGTLMPKKVSNTPKNYDSPNCVGENISPQLSWKNAPEGTKSFVITLSDPEGNSGLGVVHWLAYGIPASIASLAEGEASLVSTKFVGGKNALNVGHFSGPCPKPGAPHHYTFVVIATDLDPNDLPAALTWVELQARLQGHARAATGIIGLFKNPH